MKTESVSVAISALESRLKEKHGLESRLGFEWEFRLTDASGHYVTPEVLRSMLALTPAAVVIDEVKYDNPDITNKLEITTKILPPIAAADALEIIQSAVTEIAIKQGFRLSTIPTMRDSTRLSNRPFTCGTHVNSSLHRADESPVLVADREMNATPKTASVAEGIMQVNRETPLWSFQDANDVVRLHQGYSTPNRYGMGDKRPTRKRGIHIRITYPPLPRGTPTETPLEGAYHAYIEERFPNSRIDPHVLAFRTLLGQYHGIEHPSHTGGKSVSFDKEGEPMPDSWEKLQAAHTPLRAGSITASYIGDLYDLQTLEAIDEQGRESGLPFVRQEPLEKPMHQVVLQQRAGVSSGREF